MQKFLVSSANVLLCLRLGTPVMMTVTPVALLSVLGDDSGMKAKAPWHSQIQAYFQPFAQPNRLKKNYLISRRLYSLFM